MHPRLLRLRTKNIDIRLDMRTSAFEMLGYSASAQGLFDVVKKRILGLQAVPQVRVPALGYDIRGISYKLTSGRWQERLLTEMQAAGGLQWMEDGAAKLASGLPPAGARLGLVLAGTGEGFIVFDAAGDRLTGGGTAPRIWEKL